MVITTRLAVCVPPSWFRSGSHRFAFAAQIDGLAKNARAQPEIGVGLAELVRLAADIAGDTEAVAQTEALVDFRIDPDFRALPRAEAAVERDVEGFAAIFSRRQAVRALVAGAECRLIPPDGGGLTVDGPLLRAGVIGRCGVVRHRRGRPAQERHEQKAA